MRHSSVTGRGGVVPRLIGPGHSWRPETNFVVRDCGRYTSRLSDCYSATSNSSPCE